MSTVPVTSLEELNVIPLAEVDTPALVTFADELAAVPRYFGTAAVPRPSSRWRSVLCHPAVVRGVAALVDGELVGVGRLVARTSGGADLYLAVSPPWRRLGIGSHLVQSAMSLAGDLGLTPMTAIAEHRKAPVRALARRFSMVDTRDGPRGVEYSLPLAS